MNTTPYPTPGFAAVMLCLSVGVLAGCGSTQSLDPEAGAPETAERWSSPAQTGGSSPAVPSTPTPAEEPTGVHAGAYDEAFRTDLAAHTGQWVTLIGVVGDLIGSRSAYELADPADPDLDPLLISAQYAVPDLEAGDLVEVSGTVRQEFQPPVVEESVAGDEQSGFYDQHLGEPYLDEAQVEVIESPDQ